MLISSILQCPRFFCHWYLSQKACKLLPQRALRMAALRHAINLFRGTLLDLAPARINSMLDTLHGGQCYQDGQESEEAAGQKGHASAQAEERPGNKRADRASQTANALREAQDLALLVL